MKQEKLLLTAFVALFALAAVAQPLFRDRGRVSVEGTIRSVVADTGGYRVRLVGNDTRFWLPNDVVRGRSGGLRAGTLVRFGGSLRGGMVFVESIDWPDVRGYNVKTIRGIVERIDFRRGELTLRGEDSGRRIFIDAGRVRGALGNLRRGDRVEISGRWNGETFVAGRIETDFDHHR